MNTDHYCFCELAPLYALDLLNESERAWVEQQVEECPELVEELASYQSAVTAIPYSLPTVSPAPTLKHQLFEQLGLEPPTPAPMIAESGGTPSSPAFFATRSQELNWQPHPVAVGIYLAIVHRDEIKREVVGFLRAEPESRYPLHRHAAVEEIFMLEGDLVVGDEVFGAGDYIRSQPGSSHAPHTNGGCCFFFHTSLDDEYLECAITRS
ncbi:hypothetical protein OsccyDRAFT_1629 [Leptolyngbyaceae cyanobacterium JSC-12]|nr:hypothetical protein OsccyDRAFT_1629 [Leptolyngbyaceae cyanobacterium JSC-12]